MFENFAQTQIRNTIAAVIVIAIVGILFLWWKFSTGGSFTTGKESTKSEGSSFNKAV